MPELFIDTEAVMEFPQLLSHARSLSAATGRRAVPGRVKASGWVNSLPVLVVVLGMEPIQDVHVARPGLVVVDIAAADDATALALQAVLAGRWATATAERTTRDPGQPGVRPRLYADLEQEVADGGAEAGQSGAAAGPRLRG